MIIKIKQGWELPHSAVTPEHVHTSRREFIRSATAGALGLTAGVTLGEGETSSLLEAQAALTATRNPKFVARDRLNTYEEITTYNNYYEFGSDHADPGKNAGRLKVVPWTVKVEGLTRKPGTYAVDELVNFKALEERVYRHRCVEAWSMVMPFIGVPLGDVLKRVEPAPSARFVEFTTLLRPSEMPGQRTNSLKWPYVEGLRLDEAMHPLSMMVVGLYGKVLPNQNGAPLRVHVPWKYGFKSGKAIVRIRFTDTQPATSWNIAWPAAYGFYANVNPSVAHPDWSQDREARLPGLFRNTPTQMFNGYGNEVASLYAGMDLRKNY